MNVKADVVRRLDSLLQKADTVLATHKPNPPNVIGFPTLDSQAFTEWQTQSLTYLVNLLGPDHTYVDHFRKQVTQGFTGSVKSGKGILQAVREDIEAGYLTRIETLVSADIFDDFLEMAEYLFSQGYKDSTASLVGAVLENGLRRICLAHGATLSAKEDISSLNKKLADAEVYNRLTQKKVQVWNDIRNNADHGKFSEYKADDVNEMLEGVRNFLEQYLQ
jgi:hypothetical protein